MTSRPAPAGRIETSGEHDQHRVGGRMKRQVLDISGATLASAGATAIDGMLYAALVWTLVGPEHISIGIAAGMAAAAGGAIHWALSRFWVFERFEAPVKKSALAYLTMSWVGAALHGAATGELVHWLGPSVSWFVSKLAVWLLWTYPLSRYVIFGGLGARDGSETPR